MKILMQVSCRKHNCLWFLHSGTVQRRLPPKAPISARHGLPSGSGGITVFFFADCCLIVYSSVIRRARYQCAPGVFGCRKARPRGSHYTLAGEPGKTRYLNVCKLYGIHPSEQYVFHLRSDG